jgi:hypothetical protein
VEQQVYLEEPMQPSIAAVIENAPHKIRGKIELLEYLIGIAQNTQGAEVWRALFAEMHASLSHSCEHP